MDRCGLLAHPTVPNREGWIAPPFMYNMQHIVVKTPVTTNGEDFLFHQDEMNIRYYSEKGMTTLKLVIFLFSRKLKRHYSKHNHFGLTHSTSVAETARQSGTMVLCTCICFWKMVRKENYIIMETTEKIKNPYHLRAGRHELC